MRLATTFSLLVHTHTPSGQNLPKPSCHALLLIGTSRWQHSSLLDVVLLICAFFVWHSKQLSMEFGAKETIGSIILPIVMHQNSFAQWIKPLETECPLYISRMWLSTEAWWLGGWSEAFRKGLQVSYPIQVLCKFCNLTKYSVL